jgi:tricorn protease
MDWNQKYVDDKSKNRIAYVHMKNMGLGEYERFVQDMTRDWYKKDALIFDLRYNTGGNVHDLVLNFLAQKPYLQWKYREGALTPQPNFGVAAKPIVLLINEQSLSDAEMTATGFKALKLGKIIGTETYRWIIFTSGKRLVDGSSYRLPSWGCYTLDGKNIEKEGTAPDIYVKQTFVDRLNDKDPQLDKAIEEILKDLK